MIFGDWVGFMMFVLWRCVLLWGLFFLDFGFFVWERSRREICISCLNCFLYVCVVEEGLFLMLELLNFWIICWFFYGEWWRRIMRSVFWFWSFLIWILMVFFVLDYWVLCFWMLLIFGFVVCNVFCIFGSRVFVSLYIFFCWCGFIIVICVVLEGN